MPISQTDCYFENKSYYSFLEDSAFSIGVLKCFPVLRLKPTQILTSNLLKGAIILHSLSIWWITFILTCVNEIYRTYLIV